MCRNLILLPFLPSLYNLWWSKYLSSSATVSLQFSTSSSHLKSETSLECLSWRALSYCFCLMFFMVSSEDKCSRQDFTCFSSTINFLENSLMASVFSIYNFFCSNNVLMLDLGYKLGRQSFPLLSVRGVVLSLFRLCQAQ